MAPSTAASVLQRATDGSGRAESAPAVRLEAGNVWQGCALTLCRGLWRWPAFRSGTKPRAAAGACSVAAPALVHRVLAPLQRGRFAEPGHGRAAKNQVQEMVRRLLQLPTLPGSDAADALGMAITHAHVGAAMARLAEGGTLQRRQHAMYKGGRSY